MKPFDYYSKTQIPYPNKKDYTTFYVYDKGVCILEEKSSSTTGSIARSHLKQKYPTAVIQEVLDEEGYKAHQKQYGEERHKLQEEFVNDLFEEFGVSDNPKRHKAFALAWEQGHAYGLEEVYNKFDDLVELIRD